MTWRRSVTLTVAAVLLLTACTDKEQGQPTGQQLTIVAGGGTDPVATKALDLALTGTARDLEIGSDGTVRLLTTDGGRARIWQFKPGGQVQRIDIDPAITHVSQLAVADDGTLYVSYLAGTSGVGLVSRIDQAGKATRIVGNGKQGLAADGERAADAPAYVIRGITADRSGRLVYGEAVSYEAQRQTIGLLRRVESDGRIRTIGGRIGPLSPEEYSRGIVASVAPPEGTRAVTWPLPGLLQLMSLSTGRDGQILAQANHGVLSVAPDGIVHAVARRRDPGAAPVGERPFTREGDAADADPNFIQDAGITADGGYVSLPVRVAAKSPSSTFPASYAWKGNFTPSQQSIIDQSEERATGSQPPSLIRLVRPDGSLTTAAWSVAGGAVRTDRVYVLLRGAEDRLMIGFVHLAL